MTKELYYQQLGDEWNESAKHEQDLLQSQYDIGHCLVCATHGAAKHHTKTLTDKGVRLLTERECWRLMGWKDEEIDRVLSLDIAQSRIYAMAGNSISINVLSALVDNLAAYGGFDN